jgi:hypothetical protein
MTVALVRAGIFKLRTLKIVDISAAPGESLPELGVRVRVMSQTCPEHVDDRSLACVGEPPE